MSEAVRHPLRHIEGVEADQELTRLERDLSQVRTAPLGRAEGILNFAVLGGSCPLPRAYRRIKRRVISSVFGIASALSPTR